jgi:hypothetical protein
VSMAALLSSGCLGGSSATPTTTSVERTGIVSGLVVIDGGAQVADNGGVAHLRTVKSARLLITGRTAAGAHLVRHSTTGKNGRFRLSLPAGRYTVAAEIFGSAPVQPHKVARVEAGQAVTNRITGLVI